MAYESDKPVSFCFKFARSKDLSKWEKIPGLAFTGEKKEYSACPVIRYIKPYYYAIYLHAAIPGHNGWVSFLARSKDLATWQLSPHNPILEACKGEGSNNSDVDLIEIDGKTYVYYFTGDQQTWGNLQRAVYPGPMRAFFESYFPEGAAMTEVSARVGPTSRASPEVLNKAAHVTPTPRQIAWQEMEFTCFAHFGMSTFVDNGFGGWGGRHGLACLVQPHGLRRRPVGVCLPRCGDEDADPHLQTPQRLLPLAKQVHGIFPKE